MNTRALLSLACVSVILLSSCGQKITVKTGTGDSSTGTITVDMKDAGSEGTVKVESQSGVQVEVNGGNTPTVTVDTTGVTGGANMEVTPDGVNVVVMTGAADSTMNGGSVEKMTGSTDMVY